VPGQVTTGLCGRRGGAGAGDYFEVEDGFEVVPASALAGPVEATCRGR
jgi:hypothetical protein